ncbi:hypothetical protein [Spongiactinospora sp. TRM90649]|uniref:hypothetical protein n=1 Tax=Spongiactinospora sp. TRM90649 TaxID=3031114 RepID=UPI0023F7C7E2|nr:hypothetical protein [Spongiactinospora sp. TRM90649]MDF5757036.1 hypothetical protein [Spongiactinospora sp. TRM90649]
MRFVTRILVGVGAATAFAVAAPAAAGAAVAPASAPVSASATPTTTQWGPYFSADHKAKAKGEVSVEKKSSKVYYKKKHVKWVKKCWWQHGKKLCKPVKKVWWTKHVKWVHNYYFTVDSTLSNHKTWGPSRYRCGWETFKVVKFDGSSYFESFRNCHKFPKEYTFEGKDAKQIFVQVSRGNFHSPKGRFGGWNQIYSAV